MPERYFDIEHIVTFADTNVVGNVYFAEFIAWQGMCREHFLATHAPDVLEQLQHGLVLATTRTHCDYFEELLPFDRVRIRMRLIEMQQNRVTMGFDYHRIERGGVREEQLVARGEQQIAILQRSSTGVEPVPIPPTLREALQRYRPNTFIRVSNGDTTSSQRRVRS